VREAAAPLRGVVLLPLSASVDMWAKAILEKLAAGTARRCLTEVYPEGFPFTIESSIQQLMQLYARALKG
jgi:hypothetical protein